MKILNVLNETPLPDDWDKSIYNAGNRGGFKKRIEYAKQKAQRIGTGTSRVAFVVDYEGRKTVLKIAKNNKGLAQNEQEAKMFHDAEVLGVSGIITVPMIDYDEENAKPTWIHLEFAPRLKNAKEFEKLTGFEMSKLIYYAAKINDNKSLPYARIMKFDPEWIEKVWEDEHSFAFKFVYFVGDTQLHLLDLMNPQNWGVYKGNPVIIDLGLSDEVYKTFYLNKRK